MRTIDKIIEICENFKNKKYNIEEFQSRLQTLMIEDNLKQYLNKVLYDTDNKLEEIRFCSLEENIYKYGAEVANSLIEEIKSLSL